MFDFIKLCLTMLDFVWFCQTLFDFAKLCLTLSNLHTYAQILSFFYRHNKNHKIPTTRLSASDWCYCSKKYIWHVTRGGIFSQSAEILCYPLFKILNIQNQWKRNFYFLLMFKADICGLPNTRLVSKHRTFVFLCGVRK